LRSTVWPWPGLLARGSQGKRRAFSLRAISLMRENRDRARQTKFNEKELCRTTPVATGAVTLARLK
jgi:hypothetical protein